MILRKPYAFLIKYFQRINILLLLLVSFVFYQNLKIYQFAKTYLATGIYNSSIDPISNYANIYVYLAFIIIIIISIIFIYLLHHKDKPYASYIYILVSNFIALAFFLYTSNYFNYTVINGYSLVLARIIRDILFISTLPYYPMILILLIRSIGIDLKNFGFQEDKEFIQINEEDREEVEVQVAFNKDKTIRKLKNKIRYFKYFILEHKYSLSLLLIIVISLLGYNFYKYFYIENKVYSMNETFTSNYYNITVKNTYLTDKDYAGNIVSENNKFFIIVQLDIENKLNYSRNFDIEKMLLFIDSDYYVPTIKFNNYFSDMGNTYDGKSINPKSKVSYSLIYEVKKPSDKANFLLKYQDLTSNKNGKLIGVKMKVLDISTFKDKGSSKLTEEFTIPINELNKITFKINSYQLLDSVNYTYQQCGPYSCPIYQNTINTNDNQKILYLKGTNDTYTKEEFLILLKKYAKITYIKDNQSYTVDISYALNRKYIGNYIYILLPSDITEASYIELTFTIRTYQYHYILKGE